MSEKIPTHYSSEKTKGTIIIAIGAFLSLIMLIHTIQFAPAIGYAVGQEINIETWNNVKSALSGFYDPKVFTNNIKVAWQISQTGTIVAVIILILIGVLPAIIALNLNPYRLYDLIHGDARKGTVMDIREMESRQQVGIRGGQYLHLGLWPKTKEPVRLIETLSTLVLAPPGTGKSHSGNTPFIMYSGEIKLARNVVKGDLLMGPDGKARKVTNTSRMPGEMFRVIPTKGKPFECNGDHILSLCCAKTSKNHAVNPQDKKLTTITVEDWLLWTPRQKSKWNLWRASVDFPERLSPLIDPYVMGVLIADDILHFTSKPTAMDAEILNAYQVECERHGMQSVDFIKSEPTYTSLKLFCKKGDANPIQKIIHDYKMDCHSNEKHIHLDYKLGSRETRLQILAGLIDAVGSFDNKNDIFDFVSKSDKLTSDVAFIARSLGFAAYNGVSNKYHRISISGDIHLIPTRIPRKQAQFQGKIKDVTNVGFSIEPIGKGEYFGIILESNDLSYNHNEAINTPADQHLYLLDDFTVTHNTASFVVPSILDTDDVSFIVNDPKPELFDLTSGHRANVGHVFMINWSATDKIDPSALDDPEKTIFYPRFNVLSPKLLPPAGTAERDTYLDAIANVLSPGGDKGGKNDYFEQKGRAALVGFLHYLCSKIADVPPGQEVEKYGLPPYWDRPDAEPCIPMLIDLVNEGLHQSAKANDEKKAAAEADGKFHQGDALGDWLKTIVQECRENNYNPRAVTEITPLISMAPNERSGILGTMDKAFLPFKNAAVRERTAKSDFVPSDMRGVGPNGEITSNKMLPISLYMCVNQAEASAFATITSLVYEVLSREFLAYGPKEINRNGRQLGPFPICFMLDEFAKLPRIEAVMTGPDLGRSKKTMYCLVAQSDSQIGKLYSKEDQQIMYATTGVKYILPQNDEGTISLIQKMVGPTTIKRSNFSRSRGDYKQFGKSNESVSLEKVDFIRAGDISGMKPGTHIVICQGFMNRPYFMNSVFFFKEPEMLAKAYNPRTGLGPKPAYPVPEYIRQRRIIEWRETHSIEAASGEQHNIALDLTKYDGVPEPKAV